MSMNPQQMQQMLAMFKQQFPQQGSQGQPAPTLPPATPVGYSGQQPGLTSAPASPVPGETTKLLAALMKAKQQRDTATQLTQAQVQQGMPAAQAGQTSAINDMMAQNPVQPLFPSSTGGP
jgi:hypothetical protein